MIDLSKQSFIKTNQNRLNIMYQVPQNHAQHVKYQLITN